MKHETINYAQEIAPEACVHVMEHSGYKASLMASERLTGEHVHSLPPGQAIPVIPIHALPGAPESWIREAGSYVVPVETEVGLWFDWTSNDHYMTAVMPVVKGMNPITGQKIEGMHLEQYREMCPIHEAPFGHGNYCEQCDYKWPAQNYVAHPDTLWWDGFRQPDGNVRQFFFSEDDERDIASAVIGKKNTVPAFGFAFFKSNIERTPPQRAATRSIQTFGSYNPIGNVILNTKKKYAGPPLKAAEVDWSVITTNTTNPDDGLLSAPCGASADEPVDSICFLSAADGDMMAEDFGVADEMPMNYSYDFAASAEPEGVRTSSTKGTRKRLSQVKEPKRDVAVGAGALISQSLTTDKMGIGDWSEEPQAVMRLYFVFRDEFEKIVERGGVKDISGEDSGYMKDLPVG
jgi:hypothetical protein